MTAYQEAFRALGLEWPQVDRPDLPFSPTKRVGDLVFVSGQIPEQGSSIIATGKVGDQIDAEAAEAIARTCAANVIYWLERELDGDLDRVVQFAKVTVYVNGAPGFDGYSQVANGASALFRAVFGARGDHARAAVGMGGLPAGVPVEVDAVVQVR